MAKNKVELGCNQLRGTFAIKGKLTGCESNNFYSDGTGQNGKPWRRVRFGVEIEPSKVVYCDLFGAVNDNVYISKSELVDGKRITDTQSISWANRMDFGKNERYKGYRLIGVTCGCKKRIDPKTGKEVNDIKYLTPYDACDEVKILNDGDSVFVRGNITYSTYNETHRINFEPVQISLCKPVDFDDIDYKVESNFTQPIVLMGVEKNEETPGEAIVQAKIVNYQSIEDVELYVRNPGLAKNLKKLKDYVHIKVWGNIEVDTGIEEIVEDTGWGTSNRMERVSNPAKRKLIITGADPESIDKESYSESVIEHATSVIASIQSAKNDYGKKDENWGKPGQSNLDDDEDMEDFDLGL